MYKYLIFLISSPINAGAYLETGLGVPLDPDHGYIPDLYGILGVGYSHHIDSVVSVDIGYTHRSSTGTDGGKCGEDRCKGDHAIETKLRLEW